MQIINHILKSLWLLSVLTLFVLVFINLVLWSRILFPMETVKAITSVILGSLALLYIPILVTVFIEAYKNTKWKRR